MKHDYNLPQINSVAPMALQSQQDFVAHDKTSYPFKATSKLSPVFKVVLNSASATVVNNTYTFNNVNFYDVTGKILRCGIASLISNGNIVGTSVFNIHLNPLVQMRTYDTLTRGITDRIFTGRAGVDYMWAVNQSDCNFEIDGDSVRRTNSLSIYFTDITGAKIAGTNTWQLTLYLYSANEE
jgi:hypothetical protein